MTAHERAPAGGAPFVQVSTTLAAREQAEALARRLVDARLAACVQIVGPVTSVYSW